MNDKKTDENFNSASKRVQEALEQFKQIKEETEESPPERLFNEEKAQKEIMKKIKTLIKDLS